MKTARAVLISVLASALAACGGGGGGGSGSPQPSTGGNPPPSPPPPSGGTPPPPASTGISTAQIIFPWQRSGAVGSTVLVRGTAADPDGVAAVRVNGFGSTLSAASPPRSASKKAAQLKTAAGVAATGVEWSVEVPLQAGQTNLVVAVEDGTGAVTAGAAEATINYVLVPSLFTSDLGDPRLLGWSTSWTRTGTVTRLMQFDMASREQTIYPELHDIGIATCLRGHSVNEFLYLNGAWDDWHLRLFDLTTRQRREVADLSALLKAGPGFSSGPFLIELVCSSSRQHAYVLANYGENGTWLKSRVVEVPLSGTGARIVTETDPTETPLWIARRMSMVNDALITLPEFGSDVTPLTRISLPDGARTALAPAIDAEGLSIAALDANRVYVATFAGVDEIIVTPPSKKNISQVPPTEPLMFSQANSIGIDLVNDRVIVGDSDLDALIAVKRATGERSELLTRRLGAGPPMIAPRRLAVTADGTTVYAADGGQNAPERLFEIDLATGDKRFVGEVEQNGYSVTGLALDEENGDAYVVRFGEAKLLSVDLETEEVELIDLSLGGLVQFIADVALDAERHRLLVADAGTDSIVAVDLVTWQQRLISQAGGPGDGPAFQTLVSLSVAADQMAVYAADQATDTILRVDLESGNREVVQTGCAFGGSQSVRQVLYDDDTRQLLVLSAYGIFVHDLETLKCTRIGTTPELSVLGIEIMPDGRLLGAGFNAVLQIDRASGDFVVVAK